MTTGFELENKLLYAVDRATRYRIRSRVTASARALLGAGMLKAQLHHSDQIVRKGTPCQETLAFVCLFFLQRSVKVDTRHTYGVSMTVDW